MAVRGYKDAKGRQRYAVEFQQGQARVHRRAPPGITHAQAKEWETELRRGLFAQDELGHKPDILLSEVIQAWLDTKPQKNHRDLVSKANQWSKFVAGKSVAQAPEVASIARQSWLQIAPRGTDRNGLAPSTINRRLCVLKGALRWAWKQGLVPDNLSPRISLRRETNGREIYLTQRQVSLLRKCASGSIGTAIVVAAYTGLRAAELLAITKKDITSGVLTVRNGKGGKPRVIPVPTSLLPSLRALPLGLSYWQLHKGFAQARSRAGLGPEVTFHCLRHSFASWLINDGVDLYTVGRLLGHSSTQTTARYAHLVQATLRKAVNRLR